MKKQTQKNFKIGYNNLMLGTKFDVTNRWKTPVKSRSYN